MASSCLISPNEVCGWSDPFMAESIRPAGVVFEAELLHEPTKNISASECADPRRRTYLVSRCPTGRKNRVDTESSLPFASRNYVMRNAKISIRQLSRLEEHTRAVTVMSADESPSIGIPSNPLTSSLNSSHDGRPSNFQSTLRLLVEACGSHTLGCQANFAPYQACNGSGKWILRWNGRKIH